MKRYISEGMEEYLKKNPVPWHMPGHKRKELNIDEANQIDKALGLISSVDVTEVSGTDDLYNPQGMIKESLDSLARVYKTYASYYLVNGATGGILTAITTCFKGKTANSSKKKILVARNCHKSVYNAVELLGLTPVYIYPAETGDEPVKNSGSCLPDICGGINPKTVEELCKVNHDIGAMVITSPTYEGVVSDIRAISEVLKEYDIKLIVDEAHGAHFPFMEEVPESAINCGADIVVQSLHKTMNALTQTAILHLMDKELKEDIEKYLAVYMTSSPSYVFMYSMEKAINEAIRQDFNGYVEVVKKFREKVSELNYVNLLNKEDISIIDGFDYDLTRIVITTTLNKATGKAYISGNWIGDKLDKIGKIVVEMTGTDYAVLISTPADTGEDFEELYKVLVLLDKEIEILATAQVRSTVTVQLTDVSKGTDEEYTYIINLVGTKAKDNIYVYPPGSYMLTEGEIITEPIALKLIGYMKQGKEIRGKL